ncbi:MAG: hypothetical protein CVT86_03100 [Alphaproteobacteria bacterium HGW-Alphaproteobacteria-8]|nr:MAG: hypothetical protein CVT86_03100 [Alphaproteobacteria bacterium HGW-Alphaproteobacteria-8]
MNLAKRDRPFARRPPGGAGALAVLAIDNPDRGPRAALAQDRLGAGDGAGRIAFQGLAGGGGGGAGEAALGAVGQRPDRANRTHLGATARPGAAALAVLPGGGRREPVAAPGPDAAVALAYGGDVAAT